MWRFQKSCTEAGNTKEATDTKPSARGTPVGSGACVVFTTVPRCDRARMDPALRVLRIVAVDGWAPTAISRTIVTEPLKPLAAGVKKGDGDTPFASWPAYTLRFTRTVNNTALAAARSRVNGPAMRRTAVTCGSSHQLDPQPRTVLVLPLRQQQDASNRHQHTNWEHSHLQLAEGR